MKPGRDLDRLIAEKVMGWHRKTYAQEQPGNKYVENDHRLTFHWYDSNNKEVFLAKESDCIDCGTDFPAFSPSTHIAHAWPVVEKLNFPFTISKNFVGYKVDLFPSPGIKIEMAAETAPHTLCLAALKAVGVEV